MDDTVAVIPVAESVTRLKAAAVLGLQLSGGLSQAAACAQVGIDPKTYRKYLRDDAELNVIREATETALVQGVVVSLRAYLTGLDRLEAIIESPLTAPRDLVAAIKLLDANLTRFVGVLPQVPAAGAGTAAPFSFDGPVTRIIEPGTPAANAVEPAGVPE